MDSDDTDSDDIEKNNNYKQGYRPLPSRSGKESGTKSGKQSRLPQIKKMQGKGIAALDYDNSGSDDSDRTVTENSDYSDHGGRKKYRSIRGIDNTYNG